MGKELNILKNQFFVSCPRDMESLLKDEIIALGIEKATCDYGGVFVECKAAQAIDIILHSRFASRVFMKLFTFDIKREKDIYFEAKKHKWKSTFHLDQTFKINTILGHSPNGKRNSQFRNSMFLGLQLKDAIVDRFREDTKSRPNVDPVDADVPIVMHVRPYDNEFSTKELVTISIDLCGIPLSNRGYRVESFAAPLRENLAAAAIKLTNYDGSTPLIDIMCGSGTLAIEAALKAGNIPASFLLAKQYQKNPKRSPWRFTDYHFFTRDKFLQNHLNKKVMEVIEQTKKGIEKLKEQKPIMAFDINKSHTQMSMANIDAAMLTDVIKVTKADATTLPNPFKEDSPIVICNPPYGHRLQAEDRELEDLYFELGENFKNNYKNSTAFIFTGNIPLLKKISLKTSSRHILYNGNIECRLAEYKLY